MVRAEWLETEDDGQRQFTQFRAAMQNAGLKEEAGVYIIWPTWGGKRKLFKMGMSKNISSRLWSGYRHAYPYSAGSFRLLAWMTTGSVFAFEAEKRLLELSKNKNSFVKYIRDKEWRETDVPNSELGTVLANLMSQVRAGRGATYGRWYVFDPKSGAIRHQGGAQPAMEQSAVIHAGRNSRAQARRGRRAQEVDHAANVSGTHVPALQGTRLLRFRPPRV